MLRIRLTSVVTAAIIMVAASASIQSVSAQAQHNTLTEAEKKEGWKLLFDGESMRGWRNYRSDSIRSGWQAVDGALTRVGRGGDIITAEKYRDFELVLEWKLSPEGPAGNSGIFYRAIEDSSAIYWNAPEMQILDDTRHNDGRTPLTSTGANYALDPVEHGTAKPIGEWNSVKIVIKNNHVEHWLNGKRVVSYVLGSEEWKAKVAKSKFAPHTQYGKASEGHIGLQDHGSFVAFRNVKIRSLN